MYYVQYNAYTFFMSGLVFYSHVGKTCMTWRHHFTKRGGLGP